MNCITNWGFCEFAEINIDTGLKMERRAERKTAVKGRLHRLAESVLSLGIPAVGYLAGGGDAHMKALVYVPGVLLAAAHILSVNDAAFGRETSLSNLLADRKNIIFTLFLPLTLIPYSFINLPFTLLIFLTALNWDVYSVKGKRFWLAGLMHNAAGGALHFMLGLAAAADSAGLFGRTCSPPAEIAYFALLMTAGAMHHDAFDAEEDRAAGYITGAVRFGSDLWWRLAVIPFLVGTAALFGAEEMFRSSFILPSAAYFALYLIFSLSGKPAGRPVFRVFCRIIFVLGAVIYIIRKVSG